MRRFNWHPVARFQDCHAGVMRQQLHQHAGMCRVQMLDEDESHGAARRWQGVQQSCGGLQPTRRGANADDEDRPVLPVRRMARG
jgi:hypothetical protein